MGSNSNLTRFERIRCEECKTLNKVKNNLVSVDGVWLCWRCLSNQDPSEWSIDKFFTIISHSPFKLNNLFQLDNGLWQANVRGRKEHPTSKDKWRHEFVIKETPLLALKAIWLKVRLKD